MDTTKQSNHSHPSIRDSMKTPVQGSSNTSLNSTAAKKAPKAEKPVAGPPAGHTGVTAPLDLPKWRFWCIFISLMVCIFLFALDQLIVATAIPAITAEFNSLTQLPWLANGFFLTLLGFNLIYAQMSQIFPSKHVMMFAVFIFEVGSLVCGIAPSMDVLILGRAIAGLGASGIFSLGMVIIAEITSIRDRPKYFGLFGVCFAIASILGPLIGGAFTDHVSWRWCFYVNLPIGGVALIMLAVFQPYAAPLGRAATYKGYNKEMIMQVVKLDWFGVCIAMGWGVSAILFLQWGGATKPWNDGSVIACIVMTAILPVVFVFYEKWLGEQAMFKLALLKRRTISGAAIVLCFLFGTFMLEVYYISEGFQAAYHDSATDAGVKLLPFILVQIVILIASSRIVPKIGRFKWVIATGPIFLMIGSGCLYSVKYGTPESHILGFESLLGIGIGLSMQNTMLAVQFEMKKEPWLISAATGIAVFIGFAGRILGLSLAGCVFENMLQVNLHRYAPTLPPQYLYQVLSSATAAWDVVPETYREDVLIAYTETLRLVYIIGVPFAFIAFCGALIIKNDKMPTKADEEAEMAAAKEKAAMEKAGIVPVGEGEEALEKAEKDVEEGKLQRSEAFAEGVSESTGPVIKPGISANEVDPQVLVAKDEGKSPV